MSFVPTYVKNKSPQVQAKWESIYMASHAKYGRDKAMLLSNTWLKNQIKPKSFLKRSTIKFELAEGKTFLKRDKSGEEYVTLVLANDQPHSDGKFFTEADLKRFEKQINMNSVVGDVDHLLYDKLLNSNMSDDMIINTLKNKPGIAKTMKAIYQKGKLWVRAFIDKRYKKIVEKSMGVSVETVCDSTTKEWNILGFSFNINTSPAIAGAGVVA